MKIHCNFMDGKDFEKAISTHPDLINQNISVFIDCPPKSIEQLQENPVNILMILEPNQLFGLHDWAIKNQEYFSCILTWGEKILAECPNSYFFPMGISWLDDAYVNNVDLLEKKYEVSFLCGAKQMIEGHHLRHRLYSRGDEIKIPKQWCYTLEDYKYNNGHHTIVQSAGQPPGSAKKQLWRSMYSICIENSSNKGYHTEKIIDAFLSKTIPIYWGCTNIGDFYDLNGIVHCKDENEIIEKTNNLTPEYYASKKESIDKNYKIAKYYANIFDRFVEKMKEIVKYNNL